MQINFDSYGDEFKIAFERHVQQVWPEIRKLLPVIPKLDEMTFWFNNALIVPGTNTGGFALSKNEIALGADLVEYSILADEMKAVYFTKRITWRTVLPEKRPTQTYRRSKMQYTKVQPAYSRLVTQIQTPYMLVTIKSL